MNVNKTDRRDLSETSSCERPSKVLCKGEGFFVENEESRGSNCECCEERVAMRTPCVIAPPSTLTGCPLLAP